MGKGIFVLSYDKRTCSEAINHLCLTNPQNDIEEQGLIALANDLDQVFKFTLDHLKVLKAPIRIVLMSTTQGASTISLSKNLNKLSGVVLFSPIIGDLETIWVNGLAKAVEQSKSTSHKHQLQNRKESMAGFFHSLKNGEFPDTANVKGATVKFWRSWMESSTHVLKTYEKAQIPVLLMFGQNDVFSYHPSAKTLPHITSKNYSKIDRNFVVNNEIPQALVDDVIKYISALPATNLISP
jgi:alpha-beta hydrolase superfamily lysophospholipase